MASSPLLPFSEGEDDIDMFKGLVSQHELLTIINKMLCTARMLCIPKRYIRETEIELGLQPMTAAAAAAPAPPQLLRCEMAVCLTSSDDVTGAMFVTTRGELVGFPISTTCMTTHSPGDIQLDTIFAIDAIKSIKGITLAEFGHLEEEQQFLAVDCERGGRRGEPAGWRPMILVSADGRLLAYNGGARFEVVDAAVYVPLLRPEFDRLFVLPIVNMEEGGAVGYCRRQPISLGRFFEEVHERGDAMKLLLAMARYMGRRETLSMRSRRPGTM
jgi:hypothetical protein